MILLRFQPPCYTHSGLIGNQHLVFQFIAFKKHAPPVYGRNILGAALLMDAQLSPVSCLPAIVQVHDHRKLPAVVVFKLIKVLFVKTTFLVQRVVKFIAPDSGITGCIQVAYKSIHQVKKAVFMDIFMLAVEPVNHVAAEKFIMGNLLVVSCARRLKLFSGVKFHQVLL